ncbi:MAG TPA: TonB family protein [Candidatus Bathyarchaeia archaeon]|nr:TonB family protein [Candidatus Bathyarchaeia archaeon]
MRSSLVISVIFHGLLFAGLFVQWHTVSRMHFPEKIYSVKVIGPIGGHRPGSAGPKQEAVKVTAQKEVPKAKAPKKQGPKVAVPKKPAKGRKAKQSTKAEEVATVEQPRQDSGGASAGGGTGIAVDGGGFPFSYYLSAIERRVSENWYSAVSQGRSGLTCVVYFRLMRNGSVQDARVETGSGNSYFDSYALRAVKAGSPFPPLPGSFPGDFLGIHFTFVQRE